MSDNIPIRDYSGSEQKIDVDPATEGSDTVHRQAVSLYAKNAAAADTVLKAESDGSLWVKITAGSIQLAAGTAAIGKLGSNPGVNIGEVSISDVITILTQGTSRTVATKAVDENSSGTTTLIPAPGASNKLYILGWYIRAEGAVDVTFKGDGATGNLTGPVEMADGEAYSQFFGDYAIPLANNEAFQIVLSAAVQVSGLIVYYTA